MSSVLGELLEELYTRYNRRALVHPDPLEFLYGYGDLRDREIAGLVASSLAYGRVAQILKSVSSVLQRMGSSPFRFVELATQESLHRAFAGFRHRFTSGEDLSSMLLGVKGVLERHGSLVACFEAGFDGDDESVLPALVAFVEELNAGGDGRHDVLPSPVRGSACKRLNLFLRWMVRRDDVDPGGWDGVPASKLIVPLDIHLHRIGLLLGLTTRKGADLRAAIEITNHFRTIAPSDPVRYDFALSRLGIRRDADLGEFLRRCGVRG